MVWRPVLAGKSTLKEMKSGAWSLDDVLKINALLDMQEDVELANLPKPKGGGRQ